MNDNTVNIAGNRILDFVKFCIIPRISNRLDESLEIQFKIFNKLHVAPIICNKYDGTCSAVCQKRKNTLACLVILLFSRFHT